MTRHITIAITDERKLHGVQKELNDAFPDLKIEFFARPHSSSGTPSKKFVKGISRKISDCRIIHTEGHIELNSAMTVRELEDVFRDKFGLSVQLFCKSDRDWIEIAATATWTLEKQNGQCKVWNEVDLIKKAN
jgi:hypothetical protein